MPGTHPRQYPGNIWSAGDEMSYNYIPQSLTKLLSNCLQDWCVRCNHSFMVQERHRNSQRERESDIVLILHDLWCQPLCTFRLCLPYIHVGINARWASVTDFLSGHLDRPRQCWTTVDAAAGNLWSLKFPAEIPGNFEDFTNLSFFCILTVPFHIT